MLDTWAEGSEKDMALPSPINTMIATILTDVRNDPSHHLRPIHRLTIYEMLGWSEQMVKALYSHPDANQLLMIPDNYQRFGYLALLTARHVLPIWDQGIQTIVMRDDSIEIDVPQRLLEAGEAVLNEVPGAVRAARMLGAEAHEWLGTGYFTYPDQLLCVAIAAYRAFAMILGDLPFKQPINSSLTDDDIYEPHGDAALNAAEAFSALEGEALPRRSYTTKRDLSVQFDVLKRLEFWEWWLTKAIPTAWELADM
jgi:hypothetical protein